MVVVRVGAQMIGELADAGCENGDLDFWRASILIVPRKVLDDGLFFLCFECHGLLPSNG
jgi:hypothetical protein